MKTRLILDIMGGDRAPRAPLEGAASALPELRERGLSELVLLGDEAVIRKLLPKRAIRALAEAIDHPERAGIRVILQHSPDTIGMEDSIRAIRSKPKATINLGCGMAAKDYKSSRRKTPGELRSAFISAGHSGAMMASALLQMGRLPGVDRPAIAVKLPTLNPNGCVVLDVGANVDCKPEHLRDFAIMGAIFAQVDRATPGLPRVGLLSNGEERTKGNQLTREALDLIPRLECFRSGPNQVGEFVGYSEGKEIFQGKVNVVVTDGFVGNLVLKSVEGLGSAVMTLLKREARRNIITPIGFLLAAGAFRRLRDKLDYAEYGAAPLLGVAGYAFICHGRSNARAIKNALVRTHLALEGQVVERLEGALRFAQASTTPSS